MNIETRQALLAAQRQLEERRARLFRDREELQDKLDTLNVELAAIDRNLTAIGEDLRS